MNSTQPYYTTVSTDFLDSLMSAKYALDCITRGVINERHLKIVCDSMVKAQTKHHVFAEKMTDMNADECRDKLQLIRHNNDIQENCGFPVADEILQEEILEAIESHIGGDKYECEKELADSIVVLFRMMQMNEEVNG